MATLEISEVVNDAPKYVNTAIPVQGILMNGDLVPDKFVSVLTESEAIRLDLAHSPDSLRADLAAAMSDTDDRLKYVPARVVGTLRVEQFKPFRGALDKIFEITLFRDGYVIVIRPGGVSLDIVGQGKLPVTPIPDLLAAPDDFLGKRAKVTGFLVNFSRLIPDPDSLADLESSVYIQSSKLRIKIQSDYGSNHHAKTGTDVTFIEESCVVGTVARSEKGPYSLMLSDMKSVVLKTSPTTIYFWQAT